MIKLYICLRALSKCIHTPSENVLCQPWHSADKKADNRSSAFYPATFYFMYSSNSNTHTSVFFLNDFLKPNLL